MSFDEQKQRGRGWHGSFYDKERPGTSSGKRLREESNGRDSKRHAPENKRFPNRRSALQMIVHTKPHNGATSHDPSAIRGERVVLEANYFALQSRMNNFEWKIYKYHVSFEPECDLKRLQYFLMAQHRTEIGGYLFDGSQLFSIRKLHGENNMVVFTSTTRDDKVYSIKFVFTRIVSMTDQESLQVLNLIQRRNMSGLRLQVVGRNYYDPQNMIDLNRFNIQLWPGYETSIRYHDTGILLNCDIAHKVMRTDTVYDLMRDIQKNNPQNFENAFKSKVLGMTVLTGYNDKTYQIHDIDFSKTPSTTFSRKNKDISIKEYYAERYQIGIRDASQPLLISQPRAKDLRGGEKKPAWLVPELCRITGLDERQRNDMNLKMALKPYSQMQPHVRRQRLLDFNHRIQSSNENVRIKEEWGLEVQRELVKINAYCIGRETIEFAGGQKLPVERASWERDCGRERYKIYKSKELRRWLVVCPMSMEREMRQFVQKLQQFADKMDFHVTEPRWKLFDSDIQMIREIDGLASLNPNMILFGTTTNSRKNSDLYSSIKKKCYADYAIPSQVITRHILNSQKNKYDSVVTKVAVQICTKLGGAPWFARCPLKNTMTIGFDIAKDSSNRNVTYGCLVATMDLREDVNFFSVVSKIEGMDCSRDLVINVIKALNAYEEKHNRLPTTIFFYRGGVSDGELQYVRDVELDHLTTTLKERYKRHEMEFKMAYIIVTKKMNTRFFQRFGNDVRNPDPGTVIDNTVTLKERYEFFLVSQVCNQGTVSPTNYNIIYDSTNQPPERVQAWTYIQAHLYYNWYGTTRIPAVLQYANKLGFLVSNYIHRVPNYLLCDKLFFL